MKRVVWGIGGLTLFAGLSFAQITAISGEVKGEDGQPLRDALIKIERKDIRGNYRVKTNKKGEYYYGGLQIGVYDVTLEVNGKEVDKVQNIRTTLGEPRVVNFNLQELKKRQEALARAAEAGQLTEEQARELSPEQRAALEKATKERQKALERNRALNDAFNAAMQALEAKQYETAVASFVKASEIDPNQHVVWAHLGDAYIGLAQSKTGADRETTMNQGLEAWGKAISLNPNDAGYHNNYALALARANKFPEAQAELQKAAEIDPPNAGKYYYNLGALLVNSGQNEEASQAFKKAIEADPNYAEAHYQYGLTLMAKAETTADGKIVPPPGTREHFETYLKLAPNGQNAAAAQAMLQTIDSTIQTTYTNPNAPAAAPAKKSKKK
ncbi:MAG TPA: tetratricopeptide repeat protein [Bryobacteraceae bacterium]|nr:tetratricopeptide repeat protein [Bryobacteraceae bacterium]HOQ46714.1 tetratricopeptide repeat protein [Bryobacteraceae bacterium]HPU72384.1 tetratricopeptide repeat protein [Bryobacteraceae bacterium]